MKLVLLLFLSLCSALVFAQSEFPTKAKWDTLQIRALLVKCNATRLVYIQAAKPMAFKCLQESNAIRYYFGSIKACVQLGIIYHTNRILDSALYYHTKALVISQVYAPSQLPDMYTNIGNVYADKLKYDSAIIYYKRALVEEKKHPDLEIVVGVQSSLITLYKIQNNYEKAQSLIPLAIANYKRLGNHSEFGRFLFNLGIYSPVTNIEKRMKFFNQAIGEGLLAKDSFVLYTCYQELAVEYAKKKQFAIANNLLKKVAVYVIQSNDLENMADYYIAKQAIEYEKNNFINALLYLDSSYYYLQQKSNIIPYEDLLFFNETYINLYDKLGNYKKQNEYLIKLHTLKDSVNKSTNDYRTIEFETKYQTQLKESKIQVQELQLSKQIQTRNFIILFFCTLIALGIFLYFKNKNTQQKNRENEQIKTRRNILELQQQLLRTQMNPHFIFNAVDSIQSLIYTNKNEQAIVYLNKFAKLTRQILENSNQAYIPLAEEVAMLHNYLSIQQLLYNAKFNYTLTIDDTIIDAELLLVPPMLTQPFIENAIKHGLKNKTENGIITIRFYMQNRVLLFEVTDNGEGLMPNTKGQHKSLATNIVNQRLTYTTGNNGNKITTSNIIVNNIIIGVSTTFEIPYICEN